MKRGNWRRLFCISVAFLLLFLTGCEKTETGDASAVDTENEEIVVDINETSEQTDDDVTADSEVEIYGGGAYSDIIFDRKAIKNQFAVYFLRSEISYKSQSWSGKGGDSVLLIAPDGTTMLYDCSTALNGAYIAYALQELGIEKIDYFVNSHPHIDHLGGFSILARYFDIGHIYLPPSVEAYANVVGEGGYVAAFMKEVQEKNIPYSYLAEGDTFTFGKDVNVKVYNPPADMVFDDSVIDGNEWSLLLKFVYKDSSVLLGGDLGNNEVKLGRASETVLAEKYGSELQADVSKMNHHGDGYANGNTKAGSKEWLNVVQSKIYVGMYGSLSDERSWYTYVSTGAETFHTALDGTVLVYTNGNGQYEVQAERERNNDYYGKQDSTNGRMTVK